MFSIHVQHTRLKKTGFFFVSARGGQVSQLVQRVCAACSTCLQVQGTLLRPPPTPIA